MITFIFQDSYDGKRTTIITKRINDEWESRFSFQDEPQLDIVKTFPSIKGVATWVGNTMISLEPSGFCHKLIDAEWDSNADLETFTLILGLSSIVAKVFETAGRELSGEALGTTDPYID